jgi:hypothetical protein
MAAIRRGRREKSSGSLDVLAVDVLHSIIRAFFTSRLRRQRNAKIALPWCKSLKHSKCAVTRP